MSSITVALAGNPNAGKTTIFNALTGARQHVGNYPGITVEKKTGFAELDGENIAIVDLPGTYSLTAYSEEEVVARRMLTEEKPDVVLHVIDSGALERNLYLTVQLLELGVPVVVALNMMDEVHRRGDTIDSSGLILSGGSTDRPFFAYGKVVKLRRDNYRFEWFPKCKLVENSDDIKTSEGTFSEQNDTLTIKALAFNDAGDVRTKIETEFTLPNGLTEEKFFSKPILNPADLASVVD